MRRTGLTALALLAVLGLAAGCGGDDESAEDTTTTTEAADSDGGEETTTTEAADDGGGDAAGGFTSDECRQLAEAFDNSAITESMQSGDDPTESLQEAARLFEEAAGKAPDEVRGDVETLAEVYGQLAEASADVDWQGIQSGDPSAIAGASEFAQSFSTDSDFLTASQNLATWAQENCVPGG